MKINKHYTPELVVAKGKEPNPILTDPYLDAAESKLVATNGHAMVVLPVETDKGERSRYLACSLLRAARQLGDEDVPAEIIDEEIPEFGVLWPAAQERSFVPWQKTVSAAPRRGDQGTHTIKVNARLLKALADAMGTAGGVALTFLLENPEAPIRVEPVFPDPEEFGLLMPLVPDGEEDVDPDQRCRVCRRLLAAGAKCPDHPESGAAPDDGSVGAAVSRMKDALAEAGASVTVRVGDGPERTLGGGQAFASTAKPKDAQLTWLHGGEPFTLAATVDGGRYHLTEKAGVSLWCARWLPSKGKAKVLAGQVTEPAAKAACEAHHRAHMADPFLKKNGSGGLVKADLGGDATAHKKGGRRG